MRQEFLGELLQGFLQLAAVVESVLVVFFTEPLLYQHQHVGQVVILQEEENELHEAMPEATLKNNFVSCPPAG